MRRQIRWIEKTEDKIKIEIRVRIHGLQVHWQFKRSDSEGWDYDTPPTESQWDALEERIQARYQRGHYALDRELEAVRKARAGKAG